MQELEKKILLNTLSDIKWELKQTREKKAPRFSWWPFWAAGWLFVLGICGPEYIIAPATGLRAALYLMLSYPLWPLCLGGYLGKLLGG